MPQGEYRVRADLNGTQFWSAETNHCTIPGCTETSVTVTIPVTVIVQSTSGEPYSSLPVYAFDGDTYTGRSATTDENGQVVFTLPEGSYRFRSDYDGVQFWSDEANHCDLPGCIEAVVEIPGGMGDVEVTIDYTYDSLYRLTGADYDDGTYFHYTYDAVGNRLTEETDESTSTYTYDAANRLTDVDGVATTWDANGNLLADGTSTYTYDAANRLVSLAQGDDTYVYVYNGLGDRLSQTINGDTTNYTLDINRNLTQVLADGTNTYLYGQTRIGEEQPEGWQVHLTDALGSVRQLTDADMAVTLAQSYAPFGETLYSAGEGETAYEYTGQIRDASGLTYLRARYFDSVTGRFITKDPWSGSALQPMSYDPYLYAYNNPIVYTDPSGMVCIAGIDPAGGRCEGNGFEWDCAEWNEAVQYFLIGPAGALADDVRSYIQSRFESWQNPFAGNVSVEPYWIGEARGPLDVIPFEEAWEVYTNPDAPVWARSAAGAYLGSWATAGITLAVGVAGLVCAASGPGCVATVESALGIGTISTGTHSVYTSVNSQLYIGQTGNFKARAYQWFRAGRVIDPIRGLFENLSKSDARAVEQVLIEHYGLENLANKINSISTSNPIYQQAIRRGTYILNLINYFKEGGS